MKRNKRKGRKRTGVPRHQRLGLQERATGTSANKSWTLGRIAIAIGLPSIAVTLAASLPYYLPKLSIDPSTSSFSAMALFPARFTIFNQGFIGLHSVEVRCHVLKIQNSRVTLTNAVLPPIPVSVLIEPFRRVDFTCPHTALDNVEGAQTADIVLVVTYRPSFTWMRTTRCDRFASNRNANGITEWFAQDMETPCAEVVKQIEQIEKSTQESEEEWNRRRKDLEQRR